MTDTTAIDNLAFTFHDELREKAAGVRIVRGKRCQDKDHLFQELAAALQFPYYFGHNWDALSECVRDLEWIPADAYVIFITDTDELLQGHEEDIKVLVRILGRSAMEWATPVPDSENFPRPAVPFRVIFHANPEQELVARSRLSAAGIDPFVVHLPLLGRYDDDPEFLPEWNE